MGQPRRRRPRGQHVPTRRLEIATDTDPTGMVRGFLYGPRMATLRRVDGLNRDEIVRKLTRYGALRGRAFDEVVEIVDAGELP